MDLREYLFRERITVKQFSEDINYSRRYVSQIVHGVKIPSKRVRDLITKATNGKVIFPDNKGEMPETEAKGINVA